MFTLQLGEATIMNRKGLCPVVASIILIMVTVAVAIAVATWMGAIVFTFIKEREPEPIITDIYDPRNSTLKQAYAICLEELERQNYAVYEAKFERKVWVKTETFNDFLELLVEHNKTVVFADSPKGRGWFFWNRVGPFKAYIWFNDELPSGETIAIYYELGES